MISFLTPLDMLCLEDMPMPASTTSIKRIRRIKSTRTKIRRRYLPQSQF
jgi:hypothetical protein